MRRRQISGQIHMFVLHFSLASVTESESWSFSLGLKDFFPPAPVRFKFSMTVKTDDITSAEGILLWVVMFL